MVTFVVAVQEAGWTGKQNGELLKPAETAFDVLVTLDTNLRYQQNLTGRTISIVVLQSSSNRLDHLRQFFPPAFRPLRKSIRRNHSSGQHYRRNRIQSQPHTYASTIAREFQLVQTCPTAFCSAEVQGFFWQHISTDSCFVGRTFVVFILIPTGWVILKKPRSMRLSLTANPQPSS